MEERIQVAVREGRGTRASRRLRQDGQIPAVIYGHGEDTLVLSVPAADIEAALRHGNLVVELEGGVKDKAFIREVQWDTFGAEVLHVDFTRVRAGEMVATTVAIELRGMAPGANEGGVVEQPVHEVEVEIPADQMVDHFELSINDLNLDQSLSAGDLELPPGAKLLVDPATVVAQCYRPLITPEEDEEAEAGEGEGEEPEIIGESEAEEESGDHD